MGLLFAAVADIFNPVGRSAKSAWSSQTGLKLTTFSPFVLILHSSPHLQIYVWITQLQYDGLPGRTLLRKRIFIALLTQPAVRLVDGHLIRRIASSNPVQCLRAL
jgi:hypothetical protein